MSDTNDLSEVLTAVGPRLRALRHLRDLTLDQVSDATGISLSTLSRLESGITLAALFNLYPDMSLASPADSLPPVPSLFTNSAQILPVRLA